jgi:hypothetical protein
MNCNIGIITASLLICSLAGPVRAELAETALAGAGTPGLNSSAPGNGGGQAVINSLLDSFAGIGSSNPFSNGNNDPSIAIAPPVSETTLFSAFTRADSFMNTYYSRSGTDDAPTIASLSRSAVFAAATGADRFVLPEAGLAAIVQGHFVGSGDVVGAAVLAPMQASGSSTSLLQTSSNIAPASPTGPPPSVPLPLPILFTASGLAALLALRKRAGNQCPHAEQIC